MSADASSVNAQETALPAYGTRALRLAEAMASAFAMPIGIVDPGGNEIPVVWGVRGEDADAIATRWRRPSTGAAVHRRSGPLGEGGFVAVPIPIGGREGWLAALGGPTATPSPEAVMSLLAEMGEDWRHQRDALALWLERLEGENRRMARAQEVAGIGTIAFDFATGALEVSDRALRILGRDAAGDLQSVVEEFDRYDRPALLRVLTGAEPDQRVFDLERSLAGAEDRWVRLAGEVVPYGGPPRHLFATVRDVTPEHRALAAMQALARTDALTGLPNRTVLDETVDRAVRASEPDRSLVGLLLVDVDDLGEINDTLGHPAGDEALRYVARALTSLVRTHDTVLRIGGDEFAVVLPRAANVEGLLGLAERIRATLCSPTTLSGRPVDLSVSIGLAFHPDDVSLEVSLTRAADQALAEARSSGRGRVHRFEPELRQRRETHRALIARVREGLERGEFVPHFQPKLDLATGTVVGFEALCRWEHPTEGVLGPTVFEPAFADPDVGGPLSDVCLDGGFAAARRLEAAGLPFGHIAINLNAAQLQRATLLREVERLQDAWSVPPDAIVFEIVESVLIRERRQVQDNLLGLFEAGYRISLDDFGTGYASLTHIREPFIREVKIDRSFVANTRSSPQDHQIVSAIVQMARRMGLTMVAEGIEDEGTLRALRDIGCTVGQGLVFCDALPFEAAREFLSRQERIADLLNSVEDPPEEE